MKNKKGFTLVELLAVIAIIAVLALIAVPSVTKLFKNSKKNAFNSEVETIRKEIKKEFIKRGAEGEIKTIIASVGDDPVELTGKEIDYHAELDEDGNITYLEVTDGEFYYQYSNINETKEEKIIEVQDMEKENVVSKIEFLSNNVLTENVFIYENNYEIYDESNIVPIIITNMSDKNIKIQVKYGNKVLSITEKDSEGNYIEEYQIASKTEDDIKFVKLPKNIIAAVTKGNKNYLQITATIVLDEKGEGTADDVVVSTNYKNKISFTKTKKDIIITNVKSNKIDEVFYNQTGVFVPKGTDVGNLNISVKNDSDSIYKFVNIFRAELKEIEVGKINNKEYTEVLLAGEELEEYKNYLMDGKYISNKTSTTFAPPQFNTNSNYIQKIHFDFEEFENPGVYASGNITIATKANSSATKFGKYEVTFQNKDHGTQFCNKIQCFGDGELTFDSKNGLELGVEKETVKLTIDQSMSVKDTYSVYMTIKADTNQIGMPAGGFPATILSISEANLKYLTWIGFYNNYMQVYSYFNGQAKGNINSELTTTGFSSFDVSKYSGKTMHIQITAKRGGKTNVYINEELVKTFDSGKDPVAYTISTIGDLRPSRGLKFTGTIYALSLYNTELDSQGLNWNWKYANENWNNLD